MNNPETELRDRIAAALREHYLCTSRDEADADGRMPCRCGDWHEPGPMDGDEYDWDAHLADVAVAVLPGPAATRSAAPTDAERRDRYARALHRCGAQLDDAGSLADLDDIEQVHVLADAVIAVADAEQEELRVELERKADDWREQAFRNSQALAEARSATLLEAADFLRDAHFRDGLTVQEIGTALRHMADRAAVQQPAAGQDETPDAEVLAALFEGFGNLLATSSRDWGTCRVDAWLYAVILGWDCEQDVHDDTCVHGAMEEMQQLHGWDDEAVAKARRYRAIVRELTAPPAVVPQPEEAKPTVLHAIPLPGSNGISACCGRPPCEFVGERVTSDPDEVTCTGATPTKEA